MLLEKTWLRVCGTALVAGVAFVWVGHGLSLRIEAWQVAVVAVAAGAGAWFRVRKQQRGE